MPKYGFVWVPRPRDDSPNEELECIVCKPRDGNGDPGKLKAGRATEEDPDIDTTKCIGLG